ncbi:MAG: nicotinate (nicotinamide) nucleotide adenylyltransferase [Acidobacteria bacterium]|nr:nicotinate (nicotinamide) nucleotide adenylyltransferase [Acidobacteriota bacterium]
MDVSSEEIGLLQETRLGAFGGTFNPIHIGHIHVARRIQRLFGLSQVHFVVAATPPHKPPERIVPLIHRYAMISLALSGTPAFVPSLLELEPPASPFSIHTLRKLSRKVAARASCVYFIGGGDSLRDVRTWHESEQLLAAFNFIFVMRPGAEVGDPSQFLPSGVMDRVIDLRHGASGSVRRSIRRSQADKRRHIYLLDVGAPDISASVVRLRLAARRNIDGLVPTPVQEYIKKLQLYGDR